MWTLSSVLLIVIQSLAPCTTPQSRASPGPRAPNHPAGLAQPGSGHPPPTVSGLGGLGGARKCALLTSSPVTGSPRCELRGCRGCCDHHLPLPPACTSRTWTQDTLHHVCGPWVLVPTVRLTLLRRACAVGPGLGCGCTRQGWAPRTGRELSLPGFTFPFSPRTLKTKHLIIERFIQIQNKEWYYEPQIQQTQQRLSPSISAPF